MTDTITNRHAITNSLGLIATTNGCIDTYGGLDIQFSLVTEPDPQHESIYTPVPYDVAKQIHLSTETDDERHAHGDEGKWYRFLKESEKNARDQNIFLDADLPF